MATISLGKAPKNWKRVVTAQMLDGTEGSIECVFKYRTAVEYGALVDSLAADGGLVVDPATGDKSLKLTFERNRDKNGEYLLKIIEGWNLGEDFTQASVQQLCEEFPGIATAVMEAYRVGCTEGRLGN